MNTVLAGGCFWGLQAALDLFSGVSGTVTGFANGDGREHVSYKEVSTDATGYAEAVSFDLDEKLLPELLDYFFFFTDPTSLNRQGPDEGRRYRSMLLYQDKTQKREMESALSRLEGHYSKVTIVTTVEPLTDFIPAEEYHQKYLDKNPGGYCHLSLPACKNYLKKRGLLVQA